LDRINDEQESPTICAANFVAPTNYEQWPHQARNMHDITNYVAMFYEVNSLYSAGERIAAIKMVRLCFGDVKPGIKASKDWVEARCK
jgi:hypothetical protein